MARTPAPPKTENPHLVELSPEGDLLQRGRPPHSLYLLVEGAPELQAPERRRPLRPLGVDPLVERLAEGEALQRRRPLDLPSAHEEGTIQAEVAGWRTKKVQAEVAGAQKGLPYPPAIYAQPVVL